MSRNPTDIAGEQRDREAIEQKRKLAREQEVADLRWLLDQPQGRRFMWRLLSTCGVYRTSFTGNSETFLREGRRQVGLEFMADIHEHCPERYVEMLRERSK